MSTVRNCQLTQLVESHKNKQLQKGCCQNLEAGHVCHSSDNTSKSTIKQKLSFTPVHTPVLSLLPRARAVRIDDLRLVAGVAHQQAAKGSAGRQQAATACRRSWMLLVLF